MLASVGLGSYIFNNHLKSALLLLGFPVLLVLMVYGFFAGLDILSQGAPISYNWQHVNQAALNGVSAYGFYAVGVAAIWMVIAYFFHGSMMRMASGSRPVTRDEEPEIYNLLENLCIAQGIVVPRLEIIESNALNAFASGINDETYCVTLTRGIIDRLDRHELEGVIGHELTHIINRDVRLLIISVIFVGMISFFAEMIFRWIMHGAPGSRRGGDDKKGGIIFILLALAILAIGYMLALVIRFAISRKREFLADAGAIEMTKNPEAMMRALLKISGHDRLRGMPDEVEQMCIENSRAFMGVFATHPPIMDRVRAISALSGASIPDLLAEDAATPWPTPPEQPAPQGKPSPWARRK